MTSGSMRRAQLVSPFGVGAMSVLVDGTSVITAGLDHWFPRNNADLARFRPFHAGGVQVGHVYQHFAQRLAAFPDIFRVDGGGVTMLPS